jgi:hypothetical protein
MSRKFFPKKSSTRSFIPSSVLTFTGFSTFFRGNPATFSMLRMLPFASKLYMTFITYITIPKRRVELVADGAVSVAIFLDFAPLKGLSRGDVSAAVHHGPLHAAHQIGFLDADSLRLARRDSSTCVLGFFPHRYRPAVRDAVSLLHKLLPKAIRVAIEVLSGVEAWLPVLAKVLPDAVDPREAPDAVWIASDTLWKSQLGYHNRAVPSIGSYLEDFGVQLGFVVDLSFPWVAFPRPLDILDVTRPPFDPAEFKNSLVVHASGCSIPGRLSRFRRGQVAFLGEVFHQFVDGSALDRRLLDRRSLA